MTRLVKEFLQANYKLLDIDIQDFLLATNASALNNSDIADVFEIFETAGIIISKDDIEKCFIDTINHLIIEFFDNTSRDEWEEYFYDEYPIEETEDLNRRIFHIYPLFQGFRYHLFNLTNKEIQTIIDKNREKINLNVKQWEIEL